MIFYQIQNLIKEGKIDEAVELAEKEYSKSKDDRLYNLYGIALFKKKEFGKASEVFGELYRKHPENLNLLLNYSRALIESGKLEEAERVLREGSMVFPESEKLSELLSECQRRKEEMKEKEGEKEKIEEEGKILEVEEVKLEKVGEKEEVEKAEEIEKVEEKIEELKREIEEEIETKRLEKEEEKIEEKEKEEEEKIEERIPEREEEKIELRKIEEKEGLKTR